MLRSIYVPMLLSTLLAMNIAYAHPPETPAYPNLEFEKDKFTWDEFYEESASDRYEQNLNDCIAQDVLARGIGRRCTQIPYNYCPDTAPDDVKNPRGANRMMSCVSHFTHYWEDRLEIVYADLIHHYESVDRDKPTPKTQSTTIDRLADHLA